jgi:hypothetical protein
MKETQIALSEFADGALQEKFNIEFQKVLANIHDPNTDFKKARKLTLEITFNSNEARDFMDAKIVAKASLAPSKESTAKVLIGMDGQGGYLASELNTQIPGQQVMRVDKQTGEIIEPEAELKGIKLVK